MKYGRYDWGNSPVGLTVKWITEFSLQLLCIFLSYHALEQVQWNLATIYRWGGDAHTYKWMYGQSVFSLIWMNYDRTDAGHFIRHKDIKRLNRQLARYDCSSFDPRALVEMVCSSQSEKYQHNCIVQRCRSTFFLSIYGPEAGLT